MAEAAVRWRALEGPVLSWAAPPATPALSWGAASPAMALVWRAPVEPVHILFVADDADGAYAVDVDSALIIRTV